jgi:hypothetical protein
VRVSPGTAMTGNPQFEDGRVVTDSVDFVAAVLAAHATVMQEESMGPIMDIEIGGKTFTPGTYHSDSAINFAYGTVVTLDGKNLASPGSLFQAKSTGAKAENVLWVIGTAGTLGANSTVEGSILTGAAITFGTESVLHGCALALFTITFESEGSDEVTH